MIDVTNTSGRSLGFAAGDKTHVVEAGETKRLPLTADDPRIAAEKHAGTITIAEPTPAAPKPRASKPE